MLTHDQQYKRAKRGVFILRSLIVFAMTVWHASVVYADAQAFTCPMHPHYIATEAGACPICGMDLVAVEAEEESPVAPASLVNAKSSPAQADAPAFTCPMHPHYIATEAGACPICGMDLVAMEQAADDESKAEANNARKAITIPPETIQNIGVKVAPAEIAYFGKNIRSFGLVSENSRLAHAITGRVAGWVEQLSITAVGDAVNKGDLIFTVYSPELISAQQDYIAALSTGRKGRIQSSAQRLVSMGVSERVLAQLKKKRKRIEKVPFYASTQGIVSDLSIAEGSYIKPGSTVATIQSYQSVWVNVSVAEKDLQFIQRGTKATVLFPNLGNTEVTAQVDYIYPTIDQSSRTGKVRLVLPNDTGALRPGAYADIIFETQIDKRLSIPSEAILRSAEGDYVVVEKGEGRFQPQRVKTGIRSQGRTEILQGLAEGEGVLVSSQFLIDSESSLRESFRKLQRTQTPLSGLQVTRDQLAMIDHLIDAALYLHKAQVQGFEPKAQSINPALELNKHLLPTFRGTKLEFVLLAAERALVSAREAITASDRLRAMAALVDALKPWIVDGKPEHYAQKGLRLFLDHGTGYHWLQLSEEIQAPYGGLSEHSHAVEIELPVGSAMENSAESSALSSSKSSSMTSPMSSNKSSSTSAPMQPVGGAHAHH